MSPKFGLLIRPLREPGTRTVTNCATTKSHQCAPMRRNAQECARIPHEVKLSIQQVVAAQ